MGRPKIVKLFLKAVLGLLVILGILFGIAYYIICSYHDRFPELITGMVEEETGFRFGFEQFKFNPADHFPLIALQLRDILVKGEDPDRALLRIKTLSLNFHPWDILRKKIKFHSVVLDNMSLHIHRDSAGNNNIGTLRSKVEKEKEEGSSWQFNIDPVLLTDFDFQFTDDAKGKSYRFSIPKAALGLEHLDNSKLINLKADCSFQELLFKPRNGPFLKDKKGQLDINLMMDSTLNYFQLSSSTLQIDDNQFQLGGHLTRSDTNYLQLQIENNGILLNEALPLLSTEIQKILGEIEVDQPLNANFNIGGPMIEDKPLKIDLDFSAEEAHVKYRDWEATEAVFSGHFSNYCTAEGIYGVKDGCLDLEFSEAMLMGSLPTKFSARIQNMKTNPSLDLDAKIAATVAQWDPYLPDSDDLDVLEGQTLLTINYKGNLRKFLDKEVDQLNRHLDTRLALSGVKVRYGADNLRVENLSGNLAFKDSTLFANAVRMEVDGIAAAISGTVTQVLPNLIGNGHRMNANAHISFDHIGVEKLLSNKNNLVQPDKRVQSSDSLAASVLAQVVQTIRNAMDIQLKISGNTLTYGKMKLNDLSFKAAIEDSYTLLDSIYRGSSIYISDVKAYLGDNFPVKAAFVLKRLEDPFIQMSFGIETQIDSLKEFLPRYQLDLTGGSIDLNLNAWGTLDHFMNSDSLLRYVKLNGVIDLKDVQGAYQSDQINVENLNTRFYFNEDDLNLNELSLSVNKVPVEVTGSLKNYLPMALGKTEQASIDLKLHIPKLDLDQLVGAEEKAEEIPADTLSRFNPTKIAALFAKALPYVKGQFEVNIDEVKNQDYPMKNLSFKGSLLKQCGELQQQADCLKLEDLSVELWDEIPVTANIDLMNFNDPYLNADFQLLVPISELSKVLPSDNLEYIDGEIQVDFDYFGKLHEVFDAGHYFLKANIDGKATIKNGSIDYTPRKFFFRDINGSINFTEKGLTIQELKLLLNNNTVSATGQSADLLPFFFIPNRKVRIDLDVHSPMFEFDNFPTPYELGEISTPMRKEKTEKTIQKIDELVAIGSIGLKCKVDKVHFRSFEPKNIIGNIQLSPDIVEMEHLELDMAGGSFEFKGLISEISTNKPRMAVFVTAKENDIQEIFRSFENFGQTGMTDENIQGLVSAEINFISDLDEKYQVIPSTIFGDMEIEITKGALINFPAFEKLTGFLFKKRKLDNILFDTLKNTTDLRGYDLHVNYFYVHSTSMDFGVKGLYSLGPGDKTNLLFEFPLGNLFKRHIEKELLSTEDGKREGMPILVEAIEENDELKFKLRLFKKIENVEIDD